MRNLEGVPQETVEIRLVLARTGYDLLRSGVLPVSSVWLTEQPDGTHALGVTTYERPETVGLQARTVEHDDREERFATPTSAAISRRTTERREP